MRRADGSPLAAVERAAATEAALGLTSPRGLAGVQRRPPLPDRGRGSAAFIAGVTPVAFDTGALIVGRRNDRVVGPAQVGLAMPAVSPAAALVSIALAALPRRRTIGPGSKRRPG